MRYIQNAVTLFITFALILFITLTWAFGRMKTAEARAADAITRAQAAEASATYWQGRSQELEAELVRSIHAVSVKPMSYPGELLTPCGLTAQELENGLHEGLRGYAGDFIRAEQASGVNALFLAALAALESGWNTSDAAEEKNNLFGWTGDGGYMIFDSKEECIRYVAGSLKELYLSPEGPYFEGYTVEAVNVRYNGSLEWEQAVRQIMDEILERSTEGHDVG